VGGTRAVAIDANRVRSRSESAFECAKLALDRGGNSVCGAVDEILHALTFEAAVLVDQLPSQPRHRKRGQEHRAEKQCREAQTPPPCHGARQLSALDCHRSVTVEARDAPHIDI
jgi:hypothetical protein